MQECFLEEKLKCLLIRSCRSVVVALDGKRQFSFWNLHGNVEMSVLDGFHSLQLKWQEISLKISKVAILDVLQGLFEVYFKCLSYFR